MHLHHFTLTYWIAFVLLVLSVALILFRQFAAMRKRRQLVELSESEIRLKRLQAVVAQMLFQANEFDEANKFIAGEAHQSSSVLIGKACDDLVKLSQSLSLVQELIESENVPAVRRGLLQSCRMAEKVSGELKQVGLWQKPLLNQQSYRSNSDDQQG